MDFMHERRPVNLMKHPPNTKNAVQISVLPLMVCALNQLCKQLMVSSVLPTSSKYNDWISEAKHQDIHEIWS